MLYENVNYEKPKKSTANRRFPYKTELRSIYKLPQLFNLEYMDQLFFTIGLGYPKFKYNGKGNRIC